MAAGTAHPLNGYSVVHVAFVQGKPVGVPEPVVTGFYSDDETARTTSRSCMVHRSGWRRTMTAPCGSRTMSAMPSGEWRQPRP